MELDTKDIYEGARNLEILRDIIKNHQHSRVNVAGKTIAVDMQTANVLVTVHDALNIEMKTKFIAMLYHSPDSFNKIVNFSWGQVA